MDTTGGETLAEFSRAVRESSLKRLRTVPDGMENWRPTPEAMSFADLAQHLCDADKWLFSMLRLKDLTPTRGKAGLADVENRSRYLRLLEALEQTGQQRADMLAGLSEGDLSEKIYDERFGAEVTAWWIIMRGNLDHEIHHRGQIATYLRIIQEKPR
ncbi:MAG TPA: DinB family protein [Acidobacteriota bacterium]|nr:DinB family protein [Acidobacteriota bacterium]